MVAALCLLLHLSGTAVVVANPLPVPPSSPVSLPVSSPLLSKRAVEPGLPTCNFKTFDQGNGNHVESIRDELLGLPTPVVLTTPQMFTRVDDLNGRITIVEFLTTNPDEPDEGRMPFSPADAAVDLDNAMNTCGQEICNGPVGGGVRCINSETVGGVGASEFIMLRIRGLPFGV